jgi:hypothetical protein
MPPIDNPQAAAAIGFLLSGVQFDIDPSKGFGQSVSQKIQEARQNFEALKGRYLALKSHIAGSKGRPTGEDYTLIDEGNGPGVLGLDCVAQGTPFGEYQKRSILSLFRSQLAEMAQHPKGQQLLIDVVNLAQQSPQGKLFKIAITNKDDNKYEQETNTVKVNFWNTIATRNQDRQLRLFQVYPTIHGIATVSETGEKLVESRDGLSPFFITVAHELTHFKDVNDLRVQAKSRIGSSANYSNNPYNRLSNIIRTTREGYAIYEHRAIFDGDPDDTSELTLRLEAGEPFRFFYQDGNQGILYEPVSSVLKYATAFKNIKDPNAVKDRIVGHIQNLPKSKIDLNSASRIYTKVRLAPYFPGVFNDFESKMDKIAIQKRSEFVTNRTSTNRIQKVVDSIEDIKSTLEVWPISEDHDSLREFKARLRAKLTRKNDELCTLQKMGLVQQRQGQYEPTRATVDSTRLQEAFKMLIGLAKAAPAVLQARAVARQMAPIAGKPRSRSP